MICYPVLKHYKTTERPNIDGNNIIDHKKTSSFVVNFEKSGYQWD